MDGMISLMTPEPLVGLATLVMSSVDHLALPIWTVFSWPTVAPPTVIDTPAPVIDLVTAIGLPLCVGLRASNDCWDRVELQCGLEGQSLVVGDVRCGHVDDVRGEVVLGVDRRLSLNVCQ